MLLGTDIAAVLAILEGAEGRRGRPQLLDRPRPDARTDPLSQRAHRLPISCIPNAGLPINVGGARPLPDAARADGRPARGVRPRPGRQRDRGLLRHHPGPHRDPGRAASAQPPPRPRQADEQPRLASSIRATDLHQEPRPLLIGERVNAQGSRRIKELLLADDYDGIVRVAAGQVEGGAHALDVCVALTERNDEADQMAAAVKALQQAVEAPLVFDSTDAPVLRRALESYPGRGIVNSVNLENGRARCDAVLPLVRDHGQCVIALTIDEQGMARTRDRKLEVARRIRTSPATSTGWRPTSSSSTTSPSRWRPATPSGWTPRWRRSRGSG